MSPDLEFCLSRLGTIVPMSDSISPSSRSDEKSAPASGAQAGASRKVASTPTLSADSASIHDSLPVPVKHLLTGEIDDDERESTSFVLSSLKDKKEDELIELAKRQITSAGFAFRRSAVHAFRAGAVLARLKALHKRSKDQKGDWKRWIEGKGFNFGTVSRYIALFESNKSEEQVNGKLIGEAERRFVTSKVKKTKVSRKPQPMPPQPTTEVARDLIGQALAALGRVEPSEVNKTALQEAKDLVEKVLARIAELESQ